MELGFHHTARFWHCHSGAFHTSGCCDVLTLHGLLYAAVQSFCHCFTGWPAGMVQFVIIVSSGKGLYLWTESFTLDEFRYTPCRGQMESWPILQHTVIFLVVKSFPEGGQRGWSFCLKVNFCLKVKPKELETHREWKPEAGGEIEAGGRFKAVVVEGSSPCASCPMRPESIMRGTQPSGERDEERDTTTGNPCACYGT